MQYRPYAVLVCAFVAFGCGDDKTEKGDPQPAGGQTDVSNLPNVAALSFPVASGTYASDSFFRGAAGEGPLGGTTLVRAAILRAASDSFKTSDEMGRMGDPDSGWTIGLVGTSSVRLRQHDANGVARVIGSPVPLSPMKLALVIWTFDGTTGRSYHQGLQIGTTSVTGANAADGGSTLMIPGPEGNTEVELVAHYASDDPDGLAALDTADEVLEWFTNVKETMLVGDTPPLYAGCEYFWWAADAELTSPGAWLDRISGMSLSLNAASAPVAATQRAVDFAKQF